jgi:acyl-CoA reductase-like NAD-dependent aldehyde dehydrogenase
MATRLEINKTYKLFINGQFPRTESGRYEKVLNAKGDFLANACLGSRKDLRNAVEAARKAQLGWGKRPAFNISQIVYRLAEMFEARKTEFVNILESQGKSASQAKAEIENSIDLLVYYAGWADKYQQVFSSVNPVSGNFFNFSVYEPTGVVVSMANETASFFELLKIIIPIIIGGNTTVVVLDTNFAPSAISFAEVIATSDFPSGVINIITAKTEELIDHASKHMDVNAFAGVGLNKTQIELTEANAFNNVKRVKNYSVQDLNEEPNPYLILDFQEVKTTWHPIDEPIAGANSY